MEIVNEIGLEAALDQLQEELAELIQAIGKIKRLLGGVNPPRCTMEEALRSYTEECTDVDNCLTVLEKAGFKRFDPVMFMEKVNRWEDGIITAKGKRAAEEFRRQGYDLGPDPDGAARYQYTRTSRGCTEEIKIYEACVECYVNGQEAALDVAEISMLADLIPYMEQEWRQTNA